MLRSTDTVQLQAHRSLWYLTHFPHLNQVYRLQLQVRRLRMMQLTCLRYHGYLEDLSPVTGNDVILDSGKLSHVNFVYNDVILQLFPTHKISNDRSNRTDILPREDELNNTIFLDQE